MTDRTENIHDEEMQKSDMPEYIGGGSIESQSQTPATNNDTASQALTHSDTRDVFISYSSLDKTTADAICATLEQNGVRCWIAPRDILPGKDYAEKIIDGINSSRMMVVVLSSLSNTSPQVLREVERAVSKGIPIIPFRIDNVVPSKSMEYFLSSAHWLDALTKPLEAHIEQLTSVVITVLESVEKIPRNHSIKSIAQTKNNKPFNSLLRSLATLVPQYKTTGREIWLRLSKKMKAAVAFGVVVTALAIIVALSAPSRLDKEYDEYRRCSYTGRNPVSFLKKAAPTRFADWLRRAESGNPIAQLFVGRCYREGVMVEKNQAKAFEWFEKSAAQSNDFAMLNMGLSFEHSLGVNVDRSKALAWYTQSAEAGNGSAMYLLGRFHESGAAGRPNPDLAFSWYKRAAASGSTIAMRALAQMYLDGSGTTKDEVQSEYWFDQAANAGDTFTVGRRLGNKLAPHFTSYLANDSVNNIKSTSISSLQQLKHEFAELDLACMSGLFNYSDFHSVNAKVIALNADDPLRVLYEELIQHYLTLYSEGSALERIEDITSFANVTEPLVQQWYKDRQFDRVVTFWGNSYKSIPPMEFNIDSEIDGYVREMKWIIAALIKAGQRKEADEAINETLELCDKVFDVRPWDWYAKDAYAGLCFESAAAWVEIGEQDNVQSLLKRGWTVVLRKFGQLDILDRYAVLPVRGKVPNNATDEDREFFEGFVEGGKSSQSSRIVRFTIPCDFAGNKFPFDIYVVSGPRGFAELQDQFRYIEEIRRGKVPGEVRDSFLRLNEIAKKENVDYVELCKYALGKPEEVNKLTAQEKDSKN